MGLDEVDLLDRRAIPGVLGYAELYQAVRQSIDAAHMEGSLKAEIVADPEKFVEPDPEIALALLDQRHAGKKLLLITNSEWEFTRSMMAYAFDRLLPDGMTWRDLFHTVIVSAGKPEFFSGRNPLYEVVDEEQAKQTIQDARAAMKEARDVLGPAMKDFRQAVRDFREANRPERPPVDDVI